MHTFNDAMVTLMNANDFSVQIPDEGLDFFRLDFCDAPVASFDEADPEECCLSRSAVTEHLERLAEEYGLPLGHSVTVELRGGRFLEGRLLLGDEISPFAVRADVMLNLQVAGTQFHASEILCCVRRD